MTAYYGIERHVFAWIIGGTFAALATLISCVSLYLTWRHCSPSSPHLRKHLLAVLGMVPVYAICAWLGLAFKSKTDYADTIRECYEAYTIYSFYMFLVAYLGGRRHLFLLMATKEPIPHKFPFSCFLKPFRMTGNPSFYHYTYYGCLQYIPIKLCMAILLFISSQLNAYEDGNFTLNTNTYPYITFFNNASQLIAMYSLVLFYLATKQELHSIEPFSKFLCIKAVVFFTFWQGIAIDALEHYEILHPTDSYTEREIGKTLQDFIVCIEMFLFSMVHWRVFPYREFATFEYPPYIVQWMESGKLGPGTAAVAPAIAPAANAKAGEKGEPEAAPAAVSVPARKTPGSPGYLVIATEDDSQSDHIKLDHISTSHPYSQFPANGDEAEFGSVAGVSETDLPSPDDNDIKNFTFERQSSLRDHVHSENAALNAFPSSEL